MSGGRLNPTETPMLKPFVVFGPLLLPSLVLAAVAAALVHAANNRERTFN